MPATQDKVMDMVRKAIQKDPDVSNKHLYEKARKIDPAIDELTLRQFHARYPLQVKRELAQDRKKERGGRKRAGSGNKGSEADRDEIRSTLLRFAKDISAAEGKPAMIDLLTSVDDYVDEIVKAMDSSG